MAWYGMPFTHDVDQLSELTPSTGFSAVTDAIDPLWIAEALEATGTRTIRRRKLPAEMVIWLVIAMALFRDRSVATVLKHLRLAIDRDAPDGRGHTVAGAIPKARARVGDQPVEWLFNKTAFVWSEDSADKDRWRGLAVYAVDGSTLRLPDTPENVEHFGLPGTGRQRASYPQARIVALNVPRSHLLAGLAVDSYRTGEGTLAERLWDRIPGDSVTILDRNFLAYGRLYTLQHGGTRRHWLIQAKKNSKWTPLRKLGPGDELVQLKLSNQSRRQNPALPSHYEVRAIRVEHDGFRPFTLLTSLVDPKEYPADEVEDLYRERWEIEIGFGEKKTHMLERKETIRSKKPQNVLQEIWGIGIAYNVVRMMMARAARRAGVPPRRISFWNSLLTIRNLAVMAWNDAPGTLPRLVANLERDLSGLVIPERRDRHYTRRVKIKMSGYPRNTGPAEDLM